MSINRDEVSGCQGLVVDIGQFKKRGSYPEFAQRPSHTTIDFSRYCSLIAQEDVPRSFDRTMCAMAAIYRCRR